MRRRAACVSVGALTLLGCSAYLALASSYGPGGVCRLALLSTLTAGTRRGSFAILRCSDYAAEAHRITALAAIAATGSIALMCCGVRLAGKRRPDAPVAPTG